MLDTVPNSLFVFLLESSQLPYEIGISQGRDTEPREVKLQFAVTQLANAMKASTPGCLRTAPVDAQASHGGTQAPEHTTGPDPTCSGGNRD